MKMGKSLAKYIHSQIRLHLWGRRFACQRLSEARRVPLRGTLAKAGKSPAPQSSEYVTVFAKLCTKINAAGRLVGMGNGLVRERNWPG